VERREKKKREKARGAEGNSQRGQDNKLGSTEGKVGITGKKDGAQSRRLNHESAGEEHQNHTYNSKQS